MFKKILAPIKVNIFSSKFRRWIGGIRRISDWLDKNLWDFIRKKFMAPSKEKAVEEQIKSDRLLALRLIREERRERFFRRRPYVLRSSTSSQEFRWVEIMRLNEMQALRFVCMFAYIYWTLS